MALVLDLRGPLPTTYDDTCCDGCGRSRRLYRLLGTRPVLCALCFATVHVRA